MRAWERIQLAAVERVEATLGPAPGLAAHRALCHKLEPGEALARAAVGALRCATRLGVEGGELDALVEALRESGDADVFDAVVDVVQQLGATGRAAEAVAVAQAELTRRPSARSAYLLGRCHGAMGEDEAAATAFAWSIERAVADPQAAEVVTAARLRRVRHLLASVDDRTRAAEEAALVPVDGASDPERLLLARARLWSAGRYGRVAALDALIEVAERAPELARAAVRAGLQHADGRGSGLTEIERDRVATLVRSWPVDDERAELLRRIDGDGRDAIAERHDERALGVLAGGGVGPPPEDGPPRFRLGALSLRAIVALREGRRDESARRLRQASALVEESACVVAPAWTAVVLGLASEEEPREAAAELAAAALEVDAATAPPRGFLPLAGSLHRAQRPDLALRALRTAAARAEPGARDHLTERLVHDAWRAHARGDRDLALELLREARPRT